MVYISHLKLRNFKSFKAADIQMPRTYVCIAGPNGSGKSNLCDSIRFVLGETSLRSLRAKKVKDLIHADSKSAEVVIVFEGDGGEKYEIRRAIRQDGKIMYRLNGKKTTRTAIVETLKRYNLDGSGRNTIAQGEVQRVINMNGKERRLIIDSVAGISDFEEKKKESVRELQTVEDRIKEASLIMGERRAFLDELGREKEIAIEYSGAKTSLTNAKGSLIKIELERSGKDLAEYDSSEAKFLAERKSKEEKLSELDSDVRSVDSQRNALSHELQSKQTTQALIRKVEALKASTASKVQLIEDKTSAVTKFDNELSSIKKEIDQTEATVHSIKDELSNLSGQLNQKESQLGSHKGEIHDPLSKLRAELDSH
ncbi:AAA family ATPase, partial [Candidatus Micrarchaeota archaeon]|nr:AAA family ATPase [Candidatus Micrarchaeota archaeon]